VAFRQAIPTAATMAFARPWRRVEELPPAVLNSWLDGDFTFSVVDSEVVLLAGKTFLKLTIPYRCSLSKDLRSVPCTAANGHLPVGLIRSNACLPGRYKSKSYLLQRNPLAWMVGRPDSVSTGAMYEPDGWRGEHVDRARHPRSRGTR